LQRLTMEKRDNVLYSYWLLLSSKFLHPQYTSVRKPPKVGLCHRERLNRYRPYCRPNRFRE